MKHKQLDVLHSLLFNIYNESGVTRCHILAGMCFGFTGSELMLTAILEKV